MVDPSYSLISIQEAIRNRSIFLQACISDRALFVFFDSPNGHARYSYVRLDCLEVTALAMFVRVPNYDNIPCFQIGYAVPKEYRDQGRAKEIVTAAIAELKKGMGENGVSSFYIEAIVEHNNTASLRVASSTVSPYSTKTIDCFSGNSALQYIRKVVCDIVS